MTNFAHLQQTIQPITTSPEDLYTTAAVQIASFDSMTEFQDVVEPHPRPSLEIRTQRWAARIGRKLGADPDYPATHIGYKAVSQEGQCIGICYWRRPGFSYKALDVSKLDDAVAGSWKGMDTKMYNNLYTAFQAKMDAVLAERNEMGCWYLEILAILPGHQGRKVGTQLLDHHLAQIDSGAVEPAPAWLESSPAGFRLYKSRKFESVGDIVAEGWEGGFPGMIRPRPRK